MKYGLQIFLFISVFQFSLLSLANQQLEFNLCRLKDAVRTVRLIQNDNNRCLTVYVRNGKDQIVAESSNVQDCINAKDKILTNLTAGQFECSVTPQVSFTFIAPPVDAGSDAASDQ